MQHALTRTPVQSQLTVDLAYRIARETAAGLPFWFLFLMALEPGNVSDAAQSGNPLSWSQEAVRILGASLLGACTTPLVLALIRRFPIEGTKLWRHLTIHSLGSLGIALGLIVVSCLLAPLAQVGDTRPFVEALPDHVVSNWLLLAFVITALNAGAHAIHFRSVAAASGLRTPTSLDEPSASTYISTIPVKSRGRTIFVDVNEIGWIETQGNYLALYTNSATHLIRETSVSLEAKLDPARFARVHRRNLVALDRVKEVSPVASGDANLTLSSGQVVRLSRSYRESFRARLEPKSFN